ncbi:MAG: hypothetical protein AAYR33_04945 [Acetobacteraceae bacterium]
MWVYEQDFSEIARGDQNCHVTAVSGRLIRHNCTTTHGVSGAPIMIRRDGEWAIGGDDDAVGRGRWWCEGGVVVVWRTRKDSNL